MSPNRTDRPDFGASSRALMHETIMNALDELVTERSWNEVSLAQVAERSGVSRQTLYNAIGGRDEITGAYVLWSAERLLDDVDRAIAEHPDDLRAALTAGFGVFVAVAPEHPLIRALLASSGAEDLRTLVSSPAGVPLIEAATGRLHDIVLRHWPALAGPSIDTATVDAVLDAIVRLAISHVTLAAGGQDPTVVVDLAIGPAVSAVAAALHQPTP